MRKRLTTLMETIEEARNLDASITPASRHGSNKDDAYIPSEDPFYRREAGRWRRVAEIRNFIKTGKKP